MSTPNPTPMQTDETATFMATRVTPPLAVAATNMFSNITVPEIVNVLTALYLLLMITHKAWTMYRDYKRGPDRRQKPRTWKESP
jgi:hypothetical protein